MDPEQTEAVTEPPYEQPDFGHPTVYENASDADLVPAWLTRANGTEHPDWTRLCRFGHVRWGQNRRGKAVLEGASCPRCGAKTFGREDAPALEYRAGSYGPGHGWQAASCFVCAACNRPIYYGDLATHLLDCEPEKALHRLARGLKPKRSRFYRVEFNHRVAVRDNCLHAVEAACPADKPFPKGVHATLILAYSQAGAERIAKAEGIPKVRVALTKRGEVTSGAWHWLEMSPDEVRVFNKVTAETRSAAEAELAASLAHFEAEKRRQLGL